MSIVASGAGNATLWCWHSKGRKQSVSARGARGPEALDDEVGSASGVDRVLAMWPHKSCTLTPTQIGQVSSDDEAGGWWLRALRK